LCIGDWERILFAISRWRVDQREPRSINSYTTINAWVYLLECADGSYYTGSHRGPKIEVRVGQHQLGEGGDYTRRRLPVKLVWCEHFIHITDAISAERQIKGWSRKKKQALISGDWDGLQVLAKRRGGKARE